MTENKDKNFYMRMPKSLFDRIRCSAQAEGTSVSEFIRKVILTSGRLDAASREGRECPAHGTRG
jgi:hypothetical protein